MPLVAKLKLSEWEYFKRSFKVNDEAMKNILRFNYGIEVVELVLDIVELPACRVSFTPAGPPYN